jgi:hypothetical protein
VAYEIRRCATAISLWSGSRKEGTGRIVVSDKLGIAHPCGSGVQCSFSIPTGQVIFELELEPDTMRSMVVTFGEYPANMRGDRDEPEQVLFEQPFALIDIAFGMIRLSEAWGNG